MAEVFKRLGSKFCIIDGLTYTAPSNTSVVISNITLFHNNLNSVSFPVYVYDSAPASDANLIYYNYTIPPNVSVILEPGITLGPGQSITVTEGSNIKVSIFGSETAGFEGYKILGQSSTPGLTEVELYENLNAETSIVRSIVVCNTSSTATDYFNIAMTQEQYVLPAESDYIAERFEIQPEETVIFSARYPIASRGRIFVESETGMTVFTTFGVEYADN